MPIHLGINNCFAVKRWPDPEQWVEVITERLGLQVCQLSMDLLPLAFSPEAARDYAVESEKIARTSALTIHSLFTGLGAYASNLLLSTRPAARDHAENWYREAIELTALSGANGFGGHVGALSVSAAADPPIRSSLIKDQQVRMLRLAEHAQAIGLDYLLFENLAVSREYGHTIEEAQQLEDSLAGAAVPWTLCLDLGHPAALQTGGRSDDPTAWLRTPWRRTPVIQLQQARRGADLHAPFTAAANADGLVVRDDVLAAIDRWETSDVYLFLEVIPSHEASDSAVLADLDESVNYWLEGINAITTG